MLYHVISIPSSSSHTSMMFLVVTLASTLVHSFVRWFGLALVLVLSFSSSFHFVHFISFISSTIYLFDSFISFQFVLS